LGPDSIARTTAEGIRLRAEPSTAAPQVNLLNEGTDVIILSGPATDTSDPALEWWEVLPTGDFCDDCSFEPRPGWMTTGPNKEWLLPVDFDCPASSTFTAESWKASHPLLQCFGSDPITLEGIVDYWCCRGITLGTTEPAWLAGDYTDSFIARLRTDTEIATSWGPELHLDPDSGVSLGERGTLARITGHVDDPAAHACRTTLTEDDWERNPDLRWVTTSSLAVYQCRTQFVVDSVDVLDFIPLPTHAPQG
jgi:hypothetical protein